MGIQQFLASLVGDLIQMGHHCRIAIEYSLNHGLGLTEGNFTRGIGFGMKENLGRFAGKPFRIVRRSRESQKETILGQQRIFVCAGFCDDVISETDE